MTALRISLDDKYAAETGRHLLTGSQALVRLPLDRIRADRRAGLNTGGFISGYRGSPLGGYDQQLFRAKRFLDAHNVHFQPGVNEDLAATAIWGSQQAALRPDATVQGVFGIWYGKTPGVDRTGDVFKHANMAGAAPFGGVLAIGGDDPMAKSSTLACQSEFAFMDAEMPVLSPANVQDLLDLGMHAIAMSRFAGLWVGMSATSDVVDGSATIDVDPDRFEVILPADSGAARHISHENLKLSGRFQTERQLRTVRIPLALAYARANRLNRIVNDSARPRIGIAVAGKNWMAAQDALRILGIGAAEADALGLRVMKVSMPWPLDADDMRDFARGLETVLVVEGKRPFIEPQLRDLLYDLPGNDRPAIIGKRDVSGDELLPSILDLHAEHIAPAILRVLPEESRTEAMKTAASRLEERAAQGSALATPSPRTPYFCSGCPHNSSTVVPDGSEALAGIGCHIMAQTVPGHSAEASSQMGGEGATWIGQAPFAASRHIFVNLGDGTYHHSGYMAIRAAIAAKANITYKILYNDAVAMTGGQHVDGPLSVAAIARQVAAEGAARIAVVAEEPSRHSPGSLPHGVSIHAREDLDQVQRSLRETDGVTVLIYDQTCAAEKRRRRKRGQYPVPGKRLFINDRVCEGCGDCSVQSNCISVEPLETPFGVKRRINQASCNMDFSCAKGFCPSFVEVEGAQPHGPAIAPGELIRAASGLSAPDPAADREIKILLAGIGGTGVTTVSAILAMAAHLDGRQAAALDVTGLAQKGGAVLSHLAIAPAGAPEPAALIAPGRADTVIAGDAIVAAGADALSLADPGRTNAVADADLAPTAEFVMHGTQTYRTSGPEIRLRKSIRELTSLPVTTLAERLLGDQLCSNMILTGAAFQKGWLPVSLEAMEQAITLNGVAVESNLAAFHAGRLAVARPEALPGLQNKDRQTEESLDALIARLADELTAYADDAYADRFRGLVAKVMETETALGHAPSGSPPLPLTRAVAQNFFKLMAYKDEYEVARLYADPAFRTKLGEAFGGYKRLRVLLAPPLISRTDPATGRPKKMSFGPWVFTVFSLLTKLKGLRGTRFDPFGRTQERRMERALIEDYGRTVERLLPALDAGNFRTALAIAKLPEDIRGYGPVKMARMEEARIAQLRLLAEFDAAGNDARKSEKRAMIAAE